MEKYKVELTYRKTGLMKYISHLDLVRLFQRALRRAELPYWVTQGFNPHPKISFDRALKLGIEDSGTVCFYLTQELSLDEFILNLSQQLPKDIELLNNRGS